MSISISILYQFQFQCQFYTNFNFNFITISILYQFLDWVPTVLYNIQSGACVRTKTSMVEHYYYNNIFIIYNTIMDPQTTNFNFNFISISILFQFQFYNNFNFNFNFNIIKLWFST